MYNLTLGTAQLGMNYGINNKTGKPHISESLSILDYAYKKNIRSFDTAFAYGTGESVLGNWLYNKNLNNIVLTSKMPSLKKRNIHYSQLEKEIRHYVDISLNNLNVKKLNHYLIHDFNDVRHYGDMIFKVLDKLRDEGFIGSYGCSIYDLDELEYISDYNIGSIQIPGNIFNQEILDSRVLENMKKKGTTVFVRSAFVQGLIFMKDEEVPENLSGIIIYLQKLRQLAQDSGITITDAALNYVRNHPNTDSVVFGVESIKQMEELININKNNELNSLKIKKAFYNIPIKLVDPRYWR